MRHITFEILDKSEFVKHSETIFKILSTNMNKILPTGDELSENYNFWFKVMKEAIEKPSRNICLVFEKDVIGFLQYYTNGSLFMIEEMQISEEWQGVDKIFTRMIEFVTSKLSGMETVEAFANKVNLKSIGILNHMGLTIIGTNSSQRCYHFQGKYDDLMNWIKKSLSSTE